jgi:hypothetical protein
MALSGTTGLCKRAKERMIKMDGSSYSELKNKSELLTWSPALSWVSVRGGGQVKLKELKVEIDNPI